MYKVNKPKLHTITMWPSLLKLLPLAVPATDELMIRLIPSELMALLAVDAAYPGVVLVYRPPADKRSVQWRLVLVGDCTFGH